MTSVCHVSCRCVSCTQCGATTPGLRCDWQKNYTQCAPCASLLTCPICLVDYSEGTTILQCRQCDRCAVFLKNLGTNLSIHLIKTCLLPIDGSMHLVRVSIQKMMWKRQQKVASTALCVELSRPLKVRAQCFT